MYCTVSLDNDALVKALSQRRALLQSASFKLPGWNMTKQLQEIPESLSQSNKLLYKKLVKNHETCVELLKQPYPASAVFVTFETEQCQRSVLELLTVGSIAVAMNDARELAPQHVFRGNLVLDIQEAVEPSAIRWKDLNKSLTVRCKGTRICQRHSCFTIIAKPSFTLRSRCFRESVRQSLQLRSLHLDSSL